MQVHDLLVEAYQSGHVYHGFINALIGAGASIIGGLFGRKKKQTEETITDQTSTSTSSVDFAKMSADAQAAGFNPLTAMRSGAIGGYVTSTTRTQGKNVTTASGGGSNAIGAIADGIGQMAAGGLFGSFNTPKNDPIKVRNKATGAVSSVVGTQLGSTRRAGSVVVAPRQTTVVSPVSSTRANLANVEKLNNNRIQYGTFVGPRFPRGAGRDGEIEDAMVAYRRSDGSLMYTYNPNMIDGDAAVAAAATDAANRAREEYERRKYMPNVTVGKSDRTYRVQRPVSRGNAAF